MREEPVTKVSVAEVVGAVMVTLLMVVAVASPRAGVVKDGLCKKATVFLVGPVVVVKERVSVVNSIVPATGVVSDVPEINFRGAAEVLPVGKVTVPVKVGEAIGAYEPDPKFIVPTALDIDVTELAGKTNL
jgi:hypothetical protein